MDLDDEGKSERICSENGKASWGFRRWWEVGFRDYGWLYLERGGILEISLLDFDLLDWVCYKFVIDLALAFVSSDRFRQKQEYIEKVWTEPIWSKRDSFWSKKEHAERKKSISDLYRERTTFGPESGRVEETDFELDLNSEMTETLQMEKETKAGVQMDKHLIVQLWIEI